MDWRGKTSRPGHKHLAAAAGCSLRTVRRIMRWLEAEGFAGLVSPGSTPDFRPGVLRQADGAEGNLAAVYVLATPRKLTRTDCSSAEFGRLSEFRRNSGTDPCAREARAGTPDPLSERAPRALPVLRRAAEPWPRWQAPKTRTESMAAAAVVRNHARLLGQLSAEHWRSLIRRYSDAGWTAGDVLEALDRRPDGSQHWHTAGVRSVAGWARYRLGLWLDPHGRPVLAPSAVRAAERERVRADQERTRLARRPGTDPAPYVARILADLAAQRRGLSPHGATIRVEVAR